MKITLLAALSFILCSPALAIYKCTTPDGKVVYQDAACGNTSKTSEEVKTWNTKPTSGRAAVNPDISLKGPTQAKPMLDLYRRWADAERLALSTSRIALSGPIAAMQAIQREAEAMDSPACLDDARKALVELTQKSSQGLLEFLGKEALEGMVYTVVHRRELVPKFEDAIKKSKCE